jgi:hypothetical protein
LRNRESISKECQIGKEKEGKMITMIKGYKYYTNPKSMDWITVPVDNNIMEFGETMEYNERRFTTQKEFLDELCSPYFVRELHEVYQTFFKKDRLIIGIVSGFGEHELLFFLKGYKIISSDVIPDLSRKVSDLFPGFRGLTLDIFSDDIRTKLRTNNIKETEYDILVCGMDFYFEEQTAQVLFDKLAANLSQGSNLVFTLRYPDSISRKFVEFWLYSEAVMNNKIRRQGIIQKHHGYRRSVHEKEVWPRNLVLSLRR